MKHSVFWKIILGLLIVISAAEALMLVFLYNTTYETTVKEAEDRLKSAAAIVATEYEVYDPDHIADYMGDNPFLNNMCSGMNITYLYLIKADLVSRDQIYLATGYGENASQEFISNRYPGYVAEGKLKDEQIRAFHGEKNVLLHEKNQYDDTLICYTPVTRSYSFKTGDFRSDVRSIVCAEISLTKVLADFNVQFGHFVAVMVSVTLLIFTITGVVLYFRVSKPLRRISRRMKGFVSERSKAFEPLPVKGRDELAQMSDSFNTMAQEIDRYISDLSELNRQKAELSIAKKIQRGLLEPQSYADDSVTIRAFMLPAKDVGGDLYDYMTLENGKVFVSIADVSGKGVTAALFMSRAITLLHQYAERGFTPSQMLREFNSRLVQRNPNKLFITTFVAVYDPATGELTYSNGGHNYPYILSDELITLNEKGGVAAGIFKDRTYPERTIRLKAGDKLFLYTDGVTEAVDKDGGFFGEERLEEVLRAEKSSDAQTVVNKAYEALRSFSEGAVQADDITMLTLEINPDKGSV